MHIFCYSKYLTESLCAHLFNKTFIIVIAMFKYCIPETCKSNNSVKIMNVLPVQPFRIAIVSVELCA